MKRKFTPIEDWKLGAVILMGISPLILIGAIIIVITEGLDVGQKVLWGVIMFVLSVAAFIFGIFMFRYCIRLQDEKESNENIADQYHGENPKIKKQHKNIEGTTSFKDTNDLKQGENTNEKDNEYIEW